MKHRDLLRILAASAFLCLTVFAISGSAQQVILESDSPFGSPQAGEFCGTQQIFERKQAATDGAAVACSPYGQCDVPATRNSYIPDSTQPITVLRLFFHILRADDGSQAATSPSMVEAQVNHLNEDYAPYRIQFEYGWQYVNSTQYRSLADNEMNGMKQAYAIAPDSQLNIFVSYVEQGYSFGTFPWDTDALTKRGGIVMTTGHFSSVQSVLAHEIGHCLGLWHTHHGVSEVSECSACYEPANGAEGDVRGDFCSDTDPTPVNYSCAPPGGLDVCSGQTWGPTDPQNFMGYGPDYCIQEFSPQQAGRMHCWIDDRLLSWVTGVRFSAENTLGPAPLEVTFAGLTTKAVEQWTWDFGDGNSSAEQSPVHVYEQPGAYGVSVQINATDGNTYAAVDPIAVLAYADTMNTVADTASLGESVRIDVYARNYIPIKTLQLPFSWAGDLDLKLDSVSTAGLRTDSIGIKSFVQYDGNLKHATYFFNPGADVQNPTLAPGSGAVLSLWFTPRASGDSTIIAIEPYNTYVPEFGSFQGTYSPIISSGSVFLDLCMAGDVNDDGEGPDISDLTFLVTYLFADGPPPPDLRQANTNGLDGIDLSDLTLLVNHLFVDQSPVVCGS